MMISCCQAECCPHLRKLNLRNALEMVPPEYESRKVAW